jgi:hypothetical protein
MPMRILNLRRTINGIITRQGKGALESGMARIDSGVEDCDDYGFTTPRGAGGQSNVFALNPLNDSTGVMIDENLLRLAGIQESPG